MEPPSDRLDELTKLSRECRGLLDEIERLRYVAILVIPRISNFKKER